MIKSLTNTVVITLALFMSSMTTADIYKTTDNNGVVLFTDIEKNIEGKDAEKLPTKYVTSMPSLSTNYGASSSESLNKQAYKPVRYRVEVTSPQNDSRIHQGNGSMSLSASVSPALQAGDYVELYIDGKKVGDALSTSVDLATINRGMHVASAAVFNQAGSQINSAKSSFYLYQHSANFNKNKSK